ncbi:MAG: hypothetical protein KKC68_09680, partial [Candidatus Thermoplasmatota archaeon]|nr:hypothetical protein [Candidatus Thermoplasmatota archaeon]MBU1942028.1 hypothetical protein [Candidatus Thermoplasmatota archaeon]
RLDMMGILMINRYLFNIITAILFISLVGIAASASITIQTPQENEIIEFQSDTHPTTLDTIQITTIGPISQTISFADVTFIDGPTIKITIIARLLSSRNLFFMLPKLKINVNDLTFSIKYRFNTPNIPILKRFTYETTINDGINETTYNLKHTVIVSGFDGQFILQRSKPFRLTPAFFEFTGTCQDVIIS